MDSLIFLLGILITLILVVGVHELGHFLVARLMGVKVLRFSIGFGKSLCRFQDKKGTEYVIAAIPLGGYVKMLDETEAPVPEKELTYAYNRQPIYKRMAIVSAGPFFNLLFAFFLYWIIFMVGFTSIIPLIGNITPHSIAEKAGLKSQQEIIAVNHQTTLGWMPIIIRLLPHIGAAQPIHITTRDIQTQKIKNHSLDIREWKLDELKPDPLDSLGIIPYEPHIAPIVGAFEKHSPALLLLKKGDKILALNQKPISDWIQLAQEIDAHPDKIIQLKIERDKHILLIHIKTGYHRDLLFSKHGFLGISPDFKWPTFLLRHQQYEPAKALYYAWQQTTDFIRLNVLLFGKLFSGKLSLKSLGGPITIFQSAGDALNSGLLPFISFLAFLSIAIGFINVLPIPGLDGGHLLFLLLEAIRKKPVPLNVQLLVYRFGIIALLLLLTQALVNDILRL